MDFQTLEKHHMIEDYTHAFTKLQIVNNKLISFDD